MHSVALTEHEKKKKELLSLTVDELIVVTALMLNKNEGHVYDLQELLAQAAKIEASISRWTAQKITRTLKSLSSTEFVSESYYGYRLIAEWSDVAVFTADGLGVKILDALVEASRKINDYPKGGQPTNSWRVDYADLGQRCIHKILLGNAREFDQLYLALSRKGSWTPPAQLSGLTRIDGILATTDWSFWKKRPAYFRWSSLATKAERYKTWTQDTPREVEQMLLPLLKEKDVTDFLTEIRNLVILGMHHFRHRAELFPFDPALQGMIAWVNGEEKMARERFAAAPAFDSEDPTTLVELLDLAFRFRNGELDGTQLMIASMQFRTSEFPMMVNFFYSWTMMEAGQQAQAENMLEAHFLEGPRHPFDWLLGLCVAAWMGVKLRKDWTDPLFDQLARGEFEGIPWLEAEVVAALQAVNKFREVALGARTQVQEEVVEAGKVLGINPVRPDWEYALRQLRRPTTRNTQAAENKFQTIWIVDFENEDIICKEQKMGARGWSKGRKIKWTELINPTNPQAMHQADGAAIAGLQTKDGRRLSAAMYYNDDALRVDFGRMLYELTAHPRVYLDDKKRIPIELLRGEPELQVTESPTGILLHFDPPVESEGYVWKKETPTRYRVYHLSEDQARMAWAIGEGVEMPQEQRGALEDLVDELRPSVAIQSTFDLIDEDLERIAGSPKPCFHLLPFADGYKVELYVKPLPEEPFYFKPGEGLARSVIVLDDGRRVLERDFKLETEATHQSLAACPILSRQEHEMYEWTIPDTTTALRILLELRQLVSEDAVSIEHPKGEKLKIVNQVGSDELALRVGKQRDWFEVDGKLTVNENKVLQLEALLEHLQQNDNNFVELAEGEFVALTDELRDRILEMEGLLYRKGKKLQFPGLAAGVFAEMTDDLEDIEFDDAWTESLQRIKNAEKIRPRVPKSFRAELRDYQKEGFRWMMRLAAWGVGGCLADDMGLGKTVQALAMLTTRAEEGPALVIAPASVTRNWLRETERFAPGLIPVLIASRSDTDLLAQLGTGDLALVSYGLLPFIGEELEAMEWATIVIDEAQAIKNAATKRAKIVQNLSAGFKLATTGTPIENHLGELWSLFRFLNPGLLSSKAAFNDKYNRPIARDGNEERRSALKDLVKPFILRRRKDQVLTELPPKTEIVLEVELSEEEKALYEAMRRQAVRDIAQADEQQKRFTVLAQLTKLRQAACHPRLVRPNSRLGSAKLELVGETLLEILESGHKALIFSQFVKHLKIVENWVKGQGIEYQYLDGSTPGKKREESVNAFQAGEGDVFLISLKAGGTGLNLTAADYVLHLDPWWNPAAEDQASDRAHRIGQQRPVTVYRFVSQGTIEEQIIALHAEKRDLADQILSGTGKAGKLGVDEILTMIRD